LLKFHQLIIENLQIVEKIDREWETGSSREVDVRLYLSQQYLYILKLLEKTYPIIEIDKIPILTQNQVKV
jgi:hypothetical protein